MQADAARGPGSGRGSSAVRRGATCPLCDRAVEQAYRPFCSKRCADLDLGRWLTGAYAIPGERADPADED
ncbi:MAG: DNA gyrase inhibitor YacG [Pseudomonadota bacterium]